MDTRQQQINVLLKNVLNIQEKYNNIYEVLWYDPNINRTVCLSITLPPQFPVIPPVFRVSPHITHPWVDANGLIVGHKKLGENWNQHVSLANVANEIITELKSNKPSIPPQQSYTGYNSLGRMPSTNPYYYNRPVPPPRPTPSMAMPPYQGYQNLGMNMPPGVPPVPQSYVNNTNSPNNNTNNNSDVDLYDLESLSLDELKEILNNDSKRKEYINGKDKIKEMYNVKEEMSLSNKNLAEKILATKDDFEKLKSDLRQQQTILKEEKEKFESLMNEQNKYIHNYTPSQLHSTLQQATAKADEDSEEIANDFLMGMTNADEFLKKYRKSRKLYHLRAEKMELFSKKQNTLFIKKLIFLSFFFFFFP
jgi:ubiquitin-protein ligase